MRHLAGRLGGDGFQVLHHRISISDPVRNVTDHPPSVLELCLNLSGSARLGGIAAPVFLEPSTGCFYLTAGRDMNVWRNPTHHHEFLTITFSAGFLRSHLQSCDGALHSLADRFLRQPATALGVGQSRMLNAEEQQIARQLSNPPVAQGARALWVRAKILELMARFLFQSDEREELFCDRQKRLARERVNRVVAILQGRLGEKPSLEEIGRETGCSRYHLSRMFSAEMGMTIPQFLRKIRMERAAELLRAGKLNVTEVALEVGYSSLSHFSQAFCQTIGCCPNLYPQARALVRK